MDIANVIVHVNEKLALSQTQMLEQHLRKLDGVVAPRFNKNSTTLLLVAYDPNKISAKVLLQQVQTMGYQAQLIGL